MNVSLFILIILFLEYKEANQKRRVFMGQGFDCIVTTPSDSPITKMVYWEPNACISLGIFTVASAAQCSICFDYYAPESGFACPLWFHFQCWECFEKSAKEAFKPGAVGNLLNIVNGNVLCPFPDCKTEITLLDLARVKVPDNIFKAYESQKNDFVTNKVVEKALREQEERMIKQRDRLMAIQDTEERHAELMRLDIIENILTLRCPRCTTAFVDYEGCAALACSTCRTHFCALCLKDCTLLNDAHAHVRQCPEKRSEDPYFVTEEEFEEIHRSRQENLISNKIAGLPKRNRDLLLNKMRQELEDLGIEIK